MEGLNRSAFEVYGDQLHLLVHEHHLGLGNTGSSLILIATAVEGPSSLPISSLLCEMGPILDTDAAIITANPKSDTKEMGQIEKSLWFRWCQCDNPEIPEEISSPLQKTLGIHKNHAWQLCLKKGYSHLALFGKVHSTPLRSLSFGWLLPRLIALDMPYSTMEELLKEIDDNLIDEPRIGSVLQRFQEA